MSRNIRIFRWLLVGFLVGTACAGTTRREVTKLAAFVPANETVLFVSIPDWQAEISDYEMTVLARAKEETDVAMVISNLWGDSLESSKQQFLTVLGEHEFYMVLNRFDKELSFALLAPDPAPEKGLRLNLPFLGAGKGKPPVCRIMFVAKLKVTEVKERKEVLGQFHKLCKEIKRKADDKKLRVQMTGDPSKDKRIKIEDPGGSSGRTDGIILSAEVRKEEFFFLGLGDIPVWEMVAEKEADSLLKKNKAFDTCTTGAAVFTPAMISRLRERYVVSAAPTAGSMPTTERLEDYETPLLRVFLNTKHPLVLDRLRAAFPAMAPLLKSATDKVDGVGLEIHTCNADEFAGGTATRTEKGQRPILGRVYIATNSNIGDLTGISILLDTLKGYNVKPVDEFQRLCNWRLPSTASTAFTTHFNFGRLHRFIKIFREASGPDMAPVAEEPFAVSSRKITLRILERMAGNPGLFTGRVSFVTTSEGISAVANEQALVAFLELQQKIDDKSELERLVVDLCDIRVDGGDMEVFAADEDESYHIVKPQNIGIWPNRPRNSEVLFAFTQADPRTLMILFTPQLGAHVTTSVIPDLLEPIDEEAGASKGTEELKFGESVFLLKNGKGATEKWAAPHPFIYLITSSAVRSGVAAFFLAGGTERESALAASKAFTRKVKTVMITAGKMTGKEGSAKAFTIDFSIGMPP